jgi:Fe-S-cluster containining protein
MACGVDSPPYLLVEYGTFLRKRMETKEGTIFGTCAHFHLIPDAEIGEKAISGWAHTNMTIPTGQAKRSSMPQDSPSPFSKGIERLGTPILPLVHIVQWLYLSGPFASVSEMLSGFSEPIEIEQTVYDRPDKMLAAHLTALSHLERLKKNTAVPDCIIYTEDGDPVDLLEGISQWVRHLILTSELEAINSLLCAPCRCTLCCTGPKEEQSQFFFEIPLQSNETDLFSMPRVDTKETRVTSPSEEPVYRHGGRPFYEGEPALYRWRRNWSLILPKGTCCPQLTSEGSCSIYSNRPDVCRRPQIFPYLLEPNPDLDQEGRRAYILRNKILAVWDCPYVQTFKKEIAFYAELCGLEPVFRENKN